MRDMDKAVILLIPLAKQGNPEAQYQLASLYRAGTGVPKNHEIAFDWLQKAAEPGPCSGPVQPGDMHENGWGTETNHADAMRWFKSAAENNHPMAKKKLAATAAGDVAKQADTDSLRRAVIKADLPAIRRELAAGADVNARDEYGTTVLMDAAERGNADVFRLLVAANRSRIKRRTVVKLVQNAHTQQSPGSCQDIAREGCRYKLNRHHWQYFTHDSNQQESCRIGKITDTEKGQTGHNKQ